LKGFKGESYISLESADMAYLLKLNEYLDITEFVEEVYDREEEIKAKQEAAAAKAKARRGV
jgi:hypothetical protein